MPKQYTQMTITRKMAEQLHSALDDTILARDLDTTDWNQPLVQAQATLTDMLNDFILGIECDLYTCEVWEKEEDKQNLRGF